MADEKKSFAKSEPMPGVRQDSEPERKRQENEAEDQHGGYVPTEEDYERARTEGAGNEPELPPGVVRRRGKK